MTAPRYRWQPTSADIAARHGLHVSQVVRFDHNTSPFPTDWAPPLVTPAARGLNEYPGASYAPLRHAAADYAGVEADWIVPGAGIDELILLIARAFLGPQSRASAATPTYPLYEIAARQVGAEFVGVSHLEPAFGFPLDALTEAAETSDITWLCVPSNPIGHRMTNAEIEACARAAKGLVVIDAAYAEFSGDQWSSFVAEHPHVIVLHTLSKAFGLAAIRVGYAIAHPALVDRIDAVRPPGSISTLSAVLAEEVLSGPQRMQRHVARIIKERARFASALGSIGVAVVPRSHTNFLLSEFGSAAHQHAAELARSGLVVRTFERGGPLDAFLRFTVRSPEENDRLINAIHGLPVAG
ncbi:MAG: pyridoxal phosphate-dependent aminotransferase [Acidimicrobiia bacterium]